MELFVLLTLRNSRLPFKKISEIFKWNEKFLQQQWIDRHGEKLLRGSPVSSRISPRCKQIKERFQSGRKSRSVRRKTAVCPIICADSCWGCEEKSDVSSDKLRNGGAWPEATYPKTATSDNSVFRLSANRNVPRNVARTREQCINGKERVRTLFELGLHVIENTNNNGTFFSLFFFVRAQFRIPI